MKFSRLTPMKNSSSTGDFGFILTKNGVSMEFCFQHPVNKWINTLKSICVMTNFSGDFLELRKLGEGSFAKVKLSKLKLC